MFQRCLEHKWLGCLEHTASRRESLPPHTQVSVPISTLKRIARFFCRYSFCGNNNIRVYVFTLKDPLEACASTVLMIILVNLSCAFNDYTIVMINLRPCNYENGVYVPESIGHVLFPKNMLYAVDHVRLSQNMFHGHRVWSVVKDHGLWTTKQVLLDSLRIR